MITRYDPNIAVKKAAPISEDLHMFMTDQFNYRGYVHKSYLSYLLHQYLDHIKENLEQSGKDGNERQIDKNLDTFMRFRKLMDEVDGIKKDKIYLYTRMAS